MKKINLAVVLRKNKNCLGFIWRYKNGRYGYQNDNDLGLCLEDIAGVQKYVKKLFIGRYYVYQVYGGFEDDGDGLTLAEVKADIKACHSTLFTLTKHEKMLLDRRYL